MTRRRRLPPLPKAPLRFVVTITAGVFITETGSYPDQSRVLAKFLDRVVTRLRDHQTLGLIKDDFGAVIGHYGLIDGRGDVTGTASQEEFVEMFPDARGIR